jgi:hypothetical protein
VPLIGVQLPGGNLLHSRRLLIVTLALSIAASAVAAGPAAPVALSAGSCTGWESILEPPSTIRVGRADGRVEVVEFRRYVGIVMAREWSATHPPATIEAAAVAVKQYGWYYARKGKWRSSYINAAGECYDVKSTTADQLYQPEKVESVNPNFWAAIDATWGLSVRKSDRFFLTGYRSGQTGECGADANGWKLFARSIAGCGRDGLTREQIQLIYYAPDVTFHWSDATVELQPVDTPISAPDVDVLEGSTLSNENARVEWDKERARPDTTTYQLQKLVSGDWIDVPLADPAHPTLETVLQPGKAHQFRVRLRDGNGNYGSWYNGDRFVPRLVQNPNSAFTWAGGWKKGFTSKASGGSLGYASRPGARATFTFTGRAVALVGTRGPKRGKARVYVDGVLEAEIDMYAARYRWRTLWFTREWADAGPHSVVVEVVGTNNRPRIDVDAALYWP